MYDILRRDFPCIFKLPLPDEWHTDPFIAKVQAADIDDQYADLTSAEVKMRCIELMLVGLVPQSDFNAFFAYVDKQ